MSSSEFISKIYYYCHKKEGLFDQSKFKYAIRSMFAGAFLTFSTAAGAIGADLLNSIVPSAGYLFPISLCICMGTCLYRFFKCRVGYLKYDVPDSWNIFEED